MDALEGDYEVFLSFRGADTRQGFTDVLYEYMSMVEIHVFKDDNELAIGDKIESILGAMDNSKICIPIFSPRFAESKWCLLEVTRMVELKKTIVPVFYNVTSDDVKLKTSLYSNDLQKLEDKYGNHEVQKWKNALKEVVSNKGRTLGVKGYTEFCKDLVDEVLSKLGPRKRLEIDHFVGDANKERTMKLLDMGSSSQEVVYVGIYGMGGIGKTTMTKLIHNELMSSFDHCSFLRDIRDFSKRNGIEDLPKYMYDNVEPKSVAAFSQSRQIPNIFKNKKVLLILDDVDSCEQIKKIAREPGWFGSGSRVIVTTRDKDVLCDFKEEVKIEMRYLEMEELDKGWSLELFSKCAFSKDSPPSSYQDLSEKVVSYAGGLPLAIMVIGKLIRRYRTVEEWEEFIKKLHKNPPKEVKDRLLISYEALEEDAKKIFLDIACLFIYAVYTDTSEVFYMWEACDLYPRLSLEVLQSRSLVKIDKDNRLQMHDQLKDFGRDLVRDRSGRDVTKQSRLWDLSQAQEVLKCNKKTKENIEALQFLYFDDINIKYEEFISLEHLRYLSMGAKLGAGINIKAEEFISFDNLKYLSLSTMLKLQGDFFNLLPELKWLQCSVTVEVRNLFPSNLVILNLSESKVDENWDGWSQIQLLKKLKVLNLSSCKRLGRTPVFGEHMALERLIMSGCDRLACIDPSIGKLQHLNYMAFWGCKSLVELSNESLEKLHVLQVLNLSRTGITSLPDSIGRLEKLEKLGLTDCSSLVHLPQQIGNLKSLVILKISYTKISYLPSTISHLSFLQTLHLCSCSQLQELPDLPTGLTDLRVESPVLNKVPDLSHLHGLTSVIIVSGNAVLDWSGSFPSNCKLTTLTVQVVNISRLPDLSNCLELSHLTFKCENSFKVLPNISRLRKLVSLNIESCYKLKGIPGINNLHCLTSLCIKDCQSLKGLQNLRELQALRELELIRCGKLTEIPGLGELRGLTEVKVKSCHSLERLDNLTTLKELKKARLIDCRWLTEISGLEALHHLDFLQIESCPSLLSLDNLKELQQLKCFKLANCQKLTEIPGIGELRGLTKLEVKRWHSLKTLNCLTLLKNLRELTLIGCQQLTEIPGLGELLRLTSLHIEDCSSLLRLESLRELQQLKDFKLVDCQRLTEIPGLGELRGLTGLQVKRCHSLETLDCLTLLKYLRTLNLIGYQQLTEIPGLGELICLTSLHIEDCSSLLSLDNLKELQQLENFKLVDCQTLTEIPGIGELRGLTVLQVQHCHSLKTLDCLTLLKNLETLILVGCQQLKEISGLGELPHLEVLYIGSCPSLLSLDNLKELQQLKWFKLANCQRLTEIPGISELRGLIKLTVKDCHSLKTLDCLTLLKYLEELTLIGCQQLTEIPGLGELLGLTSLHIEDCSSLLILESLRELQQLKCFRLFCCQKLSYIPGLDKLRCSIIDLGEGRDSFVIFGSNGKPLNSNNAEVVLADTGGEVASSPLRDEAWKQQQLSLTGFSVLNFDSNEFVWSSHGSTPFPISELEGKVVALYFLPSVSLFSCVDFTLDLLAVYEKMKETSPETTFEIVCVTTIDSDQSFRKDDIPCLVLHVNGDKRYEDLAAYFKVIDLPIVVIIGTDGRVVNFNAVDMIKSYGASAYPFTLEKLEQIVNSNEAKESSILWPNKLQHHLHVHQLVLTVRRNCTCDCCNQKVELWAYYCEDCDFDLHCECATLKDSNTKGQSSTPKEGDLHYFKNPTRDAEGSNKDTQGKLLDLHNLHDPAPCSKHADLLAEKVTEEEIEDLSMFRPKKFDHHLHNHQLVETERSKYLCNLCNQEGKVWSYCCKQCDFDLCSECALTNITTTEQIATSQHSISFFGWSCCLPFLSIFQS